MELKEKLKSVSRKVETLRERYLHLLGEKKEMERTIERQELEIAKLEKEVKQLKIDNEFLRVARSIPSPAWHWGLSPTTISLSLSKS